MHPSPSLGDRQCEFRILRRFPTRGTGQFLFVGYSDIATGYSGIVTGSSAEDRLRFEAPARAASFLVEISECVSLPSGPPLSPQKYFQKLFNQRVELFFGKKVVFEESLSRACWWESPRPWSQGSFF